VSAVHTPGQYKQVSILCTLQLIGLSLFPFLYGQYLWHGWQSLIFINQLKWKVDCFENYNINVLIIAFNKNILFLINFLTNVYLFYKEQVTYFLLLVLDLLKIIKLWMSFVDQEIRIAYLITFNQFCQ